MKLKRYVVSIILTLSIFSSAAAQDRMPPIPRKQMTETQKRVVDELVAGPRGSLTGPFVPLLRSPELMSRLQMAGAYLRYHNSIGRKLTEFVILITARQWTQQVEFSAHAPLAIKAGVKPEFVTAISEGRRPAGMAADEDVVYDFCEELHENQSVSDATYARAESTFGERGVVDMTSLVGYYTTLAMIMNVARSPMERGETPPLAPFPH